MAEFLLLVLAAIGLTHIVVDGKIFLPMKRWLAHRQKQTFFKKALEASNCYQCAGFWCGVFVALVYWSAEYFAPSKFVLYGLASSFLAVLGAVLVSYLNVASAASAEDN